MNVSINILNSMEYNDLKEYIKFKGDKSFDEASCDLEQLIKGISVQETISIISEIGIIPEDFEHDSSEEKLYTKASEIIFAKALYEMNLDVKVLKERSNCADIIAQSKYHGYSLVGDAKAFRLSRTAKNQKDFKVESMNHWKGENDYAVLVCPYYQYPKKESQVFKSALNDNVLLFSWEHLNMLLRMGIKETEQNNLKDLWNQSKIISRKTTVEDSSKCFFSKQDANIKKMFGLSDDDFSYFFNNVKQSIINRGKSEISFYLREIERIKSLSKEDAINELLISSKIESKINTINNFIKQIVK